MVRRTGLEIRKFSQWILHESKEKWAKVYDTGGARYGIMTTNLAEVYNWVMRGVRGLPLVGIVEFILHGTCRYFRDRFQAVLPSMPNNSILFGTFMQKKLEELRKKAMKHRAVVQGTQQHRFEILCQDKAGRGIYRKRVKQECVLKADDTCHCSCAKPTAHDIGLHKTFVNGLHKRVSRSRHMSHSVLPSPLASLQILPAFVNG